MIDQSAKFCPFPLTTMNITQYLMFPCCESFMDFGDAACLRIPTATADTAWNSTAWTEFRWRIRSGDHSLCHKCPKFLNQGEFFMTAEEIRGRYGEDVFNFVTGVGRQIVSSSQFCI